MESKEQLQEQEFKVGDKVVLKAGGIIMEIILIKADKAKCFWVSKYGNPRDKWLFLTQLQKPQIDLPSAYIMNTIK
jgi:hypothetical protein